MHGWKFGSNERLNLIRIQRAIEVVNHGYWNLNSILNNGRFHCWPKGGKKKTCEFHASETDLLKWSREHIHCQFSLEPSLRISCPVPSQRTAWHAILNLCENGMTWNQTQPDIQSAPTHFRWNVSSIYWTVLWLLGHPWARNTWAREGPFLRIFHNWCIGFGFWTVNCNCSPSSLHLTDMRCSPPDI